jgi:DNA-binding GntR family transcriptional regulator
MTPQTREKIVRGMLKARSTLLSASDIAAHGEVAESTVRRALAKL